MVFIILMIVVIFVIFNAIEMKKCEEDKTKKRSILSDIETKYLKCAEDVKSLQKALQPFVPIQTQIIDDNRLDLYNYGIYNSSNCKVNLKEINDHIIEKKLLTKTCNDLRKKLIQQLKKELEKKNNAVMSDTEYKIILREMSIDIDNLTSEN
jgi:hypothetical protein